MHKILFRIFCSALVLLPIFAAAQRIKDVRTAQEGKTIVITYDLTGLNAGQRATVSLYCSEDGGTTWGAALQKVSGDVGTDITAGLEKKIVWDVLSERERLVGDRVAFEVRALLTSPCQSLKPEMVMIKGGTFLMGSYEGERNEKPIHTVKVSDFYMGRYEVTQAQWRAVMGSSALLSTPSYLKGDNLPVENVSWDDVQEFIGKLNACTGKSYRLPTEAEWEYACRAGTTTTFNTGYCLNTSQANYDGNYPYSRCDKGEYRTKTTPVGSFAPNEWGLYDMHGNVWEWCSDWYGSDYYSYSPQSNPQGAAIGANRVLRGGGWYFRAQYCRSAYRNYDSPGTRKSGTGFRLVLPK